MLGLFVAAFVSVSRVESARRVGCLQHLESARALPASHRNLEVRGHAVSGWHPHGISAAAVERGGARVDVCGFALAHCAHRHRVASSQWRWCCCWFRLLALVRGASAGLLAGVVLLASPAFMTQAPSEYADIPLAFFFLAALALIVRGGESPLGARWLSLAGVFARLCRLDQERRRAAGGRAGRGALRERVALRRMAFRRPPAGIFLLGALPGLLLVLWFKAGVSSARPVGRADDGQPGAKALQRRPMAPDCRRISQTGLGSVPPPAGPPRRDLRPAAPASAPRAIACAHCWPC